MPEHDSTADYLADVPICRGCGLMSHVDRHKGLCSECFHRREGWLGGGPLRVITSGDTYHETPLCPAVQNARKWRYCRDESVMYADLAGRMDKCIRCHSHHRCGFDEYAGDSDRQVVIGHA